MRVVGCIGLGVSSTIFPAAGDLGAWKVLPKSNIAVYRREGDLGDSETKESFRGTRGPVEMEKPFEFGRDCLGPFVGLEGGN